MNPFPVFVSTFVGGQGNAQSGNATFSFVNSNNFDCFVPFRITCPNTGNISAGAELTVYRSGDGGATYESVGPVSFVFPRPAAAAVQVRGLVLPSGVYRIQVQVGGGVASTWTAQQLTAWVNSAFN